MKTKIIITIIVLIAALHVNAEIRFVSKTGSSTAPYTSWVTASDSIQKTINICKPGDTIYVGKGLYEEQLVVSPGLALIGSGSDSCIIDTRRIALQNNWYAITLTDSTSIENFYLNFGEFGNRITGISFSNCDKIRILNNKITNGGWSISAGWSNILIKGNSFYNNYSAIDISDVYTFSNVVIEDNIFSSNNIAIALSWGTNNIIRNNLIFMDNNSNTGIGGTLINDLIIQNNIFIAKNSQKNSRAIQTSSYNNKSKSRIINNTIYGDYSLTGILSYGNDTIINNFVSSAKYGIWRAVKDSNYLIKYNNTLGQIANYFQFIPDNTNLSIYPMFNNPDNLDFRLQKFSPLIDAGDPNIKDVDGTRSDIGYWGGTEGKSYIYTDMPPLPPSGIISALKNETFTASWIKNNETDFMEYRIYEDTVSGFALLKDKLLFTTKDTSFSKTIKLKKAYYYKIISVDKQLNESIPSIEFSTLVTNIEKEDILPYDFELFQNYPNPFNSTTTIRYNLKEYSYVKIYLFDIKGSLVEVLENGNKTAGTHEIKYDAGKNRKELASGIYLFNMIAYNSKNFIIYNGIKKLILLK